MKDKIMPSLWFEKEALEAMQYYTSIFPESEIIQENPVTVEAKLTGVRFMALNGRTDKLKPNASISFMLVCENKGEINAIWNNLLTEGSVLMALDSYPWSTYYGWISDKYGFTWQLYLGKLEDVNNQRIIPTLMFANEQQGKCEQAVHFYQSVFNNFKSSGMMRYEDGPFKDQVQHTQFMLDGFTLAAMDSGMPQDFTFNEAISLSILCKDQNEIDHFWNAFTKDGKEVACGWCQDPFGISWQIVPYNTKELLFDAPNAKKAFEAMMKMKKIIIEDLKNA